MTQLGATSQLPPDCELVDGRIYRLVEIKNATDRSTRMSRRPVAMSLKEAQDTGADFWHPSAGWIRNGRKPEQEHFLTPSEVSNAIGDAISQGAPNP